MTHVLCRARLRPTASVASLRDLLLPADEHARVAAAHKLVWALFSDGPERERDFLWRETRPGEFYFLSRRAPEDAHGLFEIDQPKPFAPALAPGDRLAFSLRANATVARAQGRERRGKVEDVVMHALHDVRPGMRADARAKIVSEAGTGWLRRQGARHGFEIRDGDSCIVDAHRVVRLGRRGAEARLGVMDLSGVLTVTDSASFTEAVVQGFGRAKAFGNGLMLIRRV